MGSFYIIKPCKTDTSLHGPTAARSSQNFASFPKTSERRGREAGKECAVLPKQEDISEMNSSTTNGGEKYFLTK